MNLLSSAAWEADERSANRLPVPGEYVCWSRMQAEAGQQLDAIIARKELERLAGGGQFFWGVGNPPALIANVLARAELPVPVVFSIMKSRPKSVDVEPQRTVVWRKYFDMSGIERPVPSNSLVTSRGDSASGAKRTHYALVCRAANPLGIKRGVAFDPNAFCNAGGTGAPVGFSQVTALLRRVSEPSENSQYEANISCMLDGSYWVRLSDPLELDRRQLALLSAVTEHGSGKWLETVASIRGRPSFSEERPADGLLL